MQKIIITFIITLSVCITLKGQIEVKEGQPIFPVIESFYDLEIDATQIELMQSLHQPKDQPFQFAIPYKVSLNPGNSGNIIHNGNESVWIMAVTSKGAKSMNIILEPFDVPEGAYIYVYDADKKTVRGAFTNESAGDSGVLPVLPVPGDKIIVECHFPGKNIPSGAIGISQVSHDFAGFFGLVDEKDEFFGASAGCEVDIACSSNEKHLLASRSVCRILINGSTLCTGTLINNTGPVLKAYILTANHCINTAYQANHSVFIFNYKSPWCNGPDHRISHSISGASLRAKNSSVDFSLMELSSFPPLFFEPYLAGWDIGSQAPENTFVIHHPEGDIMKLSIDNNPPVTASYPDASYGYLFSGFWKILKWDSGTTESGSSGSALIDQDNRIRGTLTGGEADCVNPVNDYFAKISGMFSISSAPSENLKTWLDPSLSGVTYCSGRDPYKSNISSSDTLYNIPDGTILQSDALVPSYGYSTGTNTDSLISYAEYFNFTGTGEITWVKMDVARSYYLTSTDTVRVCIFAGGAQPGNILASKLVSLSEVKDDFELKVDFNKTVKINGPFYVGYKVYYDGRITRVQPQFAVYHSGLLSDYLLNTAWFNNGSGWQPFTSHPTYPGPVSLSIKTILVDDSTPSNIKDTSLSVYEIMVYPNPFGNCISFSAKGYAANTTIIIYNNYGAVVSYQEYADIFPGVISIDLPLLPPGVYHYDLRNDGIRNTGTILKGK
jgi:lysyl endopeptidase